VSGIEEFGEFFPFRIEFIGYKVKREMAMKISTAKGRHGLRAVQAIADFRVMADNQRNLTMDQRKTLVQ